MGKTELPRWRWRLYGDPASALLDLEGGLLDGAVVGRVERAAAVYDSEKLQVKFAPSSAPLTDDENYVIVVGKNDERLAAMDEALRALEDSGVAPNLRRKWFLE